MTVKKKTLYVITTVNRSGAFYDEDNAKIVESSEEEIIKLVQEYMSALDISDGDIEVYELGRKGVLPKRTIQFV